MIPAVLNRKGAAYRKAKYRAQRDGWDARMIRSEQDVAAVLDHDAWYDRDTAEYVVNWFPKMLRLVSGNRYAGTPFHLQPWVADGLIRPAFGWKRASGARRYRQLYTLVPKKNCKSTTCSGLLLYLAAGDDEPNAQVYAAANDELQARIVYDTAEQMVTGSPALKRRMKIRRCPIHMIWTPQHAIIRPLTRENENKEGLDIHALVYDEFHAVKSRRLWDTLKYGGVARTQPLFIIITTAGESEEDNSVWSQENLYAKKVLKAEVMNWEYLPVLYAAEPDDDWTDPKVWRRVNPALGTVLSEEDMASACAVALDRPLDQAAFKRYRLNIPCAVENRWFGAGIERGWKDGAKKIDWDVFAGRECVGGLDLSSNNDLTAFALLFPPLDDQDFWWLKIRAWLPQDNLMALSQEHHVQYHLWREQGWIETTPGNVIDLKFIRAAICEDAKRFHITEIGYDPWRATEIVQNLQDEDGIKMVEVPQIIRTYALVVSECERLMLGCKFRHDDNPVLRWHLGNVVMISNHKGDRMPTKLRSSGKIDAFIASLIAASRGFNREKGSSSTILTSEDVLVKI